jgi:hypothetical protein
VAVGYEHLKRGNPKGMASLLAQGVDKLRHHTRRPGIRDIRERARADAARAGSEPDISFRTCPPPKLMLTLDGLGARAPKDAIRIEIPRR